MEIVLVLLGIVVVGSVIGLFLGLRGLRKDKSRQSYYYHSTTPQYFSKTPVRAHVPGTNKYGKSKDSGHLSSSTGCAAISCASSSSSSGSSFGGGDSGGGGSSSSCASGSSCSGGGGGCGGGGD